MPEGAHACAPRLRFGYVVLYAPKGTPGTPTLWSTFLRPRSTARTQERHLEAKNIAFQNSGTQERHLEVRRRQMGEFSNSRCAPAQEHRGYGRFQLTHYRFEVCSWAPSEAKAPKGSPGTPTLWSVLDYFFCRRSKRHPRSTQGIRA